jgi:hypothetical protein
VACSLGVGGQDPSRIPLRLDKVVPVAGLQGGAIIDPVKCDSAGNIYARFDQPKAFVAPVIKITADGERKAVFSLEGAKDWEEGEFYDFAAQPDGGMYLLAARRGKGREIQHAILSFDEEGKFRYAIPLKVLLTSVDQLAVFPSGEFLITGWNKAENSATGNQESQANKRPHVEARLLVLSQNGELQRPVSLAGDFEGAPVGRSKPKPLLMQESSISLGRTAIGDSGEIFLKFRTATPEVYALLPRATVVRRIDVAPPSEESQALNIWFASGTGLVVQFAERRPQGRGFNTALSVISIVDPQTGERLYDYQVTGDIGGVFACYAPKGFLFLWTDQEGRLNLRRAVPR